MTSCSGNMAASVRIVAHLTAAQGLADPVTESHELQRVESELLERAIRILAVSDGRVL